MISPEYLAYLQGFYTPSEGRPVIRVQGKRIWWMPWKRRPEQVFAGMSEAMAFRAQQVVFTAQQSSCFPQ